MNKYIIAIIAGLAFLVPFQSSAANCTSYTDGPHFNSFPVSMSGGDCTDYPLLMARNNGGAWSGTS